MTTARLYREIVATGSVTDRARMAKYWMTIGQYVRHIALYHFKNRATINVATPLTNISNHKLDISAQKGRIKLDIGGVNFTTSRLTLTRDSESMLAAMFSGRHEVRVEDDGTIFIDRDGTHFRYILNYLRDGGIKLDALPRNRQVLRELRNEAVFYQLHGLVQQIEKLL